MTINLFSFVKNAANMSVVSSFARDMCLRSGIAFGKVKVEGVIRTGKDKPVLLVKLDDGTEWNVTFTIEKV